MTTRVAVIGATGNLGSFVCDLVESADDFELVARIDSKGELSAMVGADIAVDLTLPAVSQSVVDFALANRINTLVGTSGWSAERIAALEASLRIRPDIGVLIIPNFSIGSVLGTALATMAARFFDSIEIVESHQAGKVDSPSGTAVRTAELMGEARLQLGPVVAPHVDQRARGQQVSSIPIHSLRMQGVVARQEVRFGGDGESLTISHEAIGNDAYRAGLLLALRATVSARGVIVGLDKLIEIPRPE